MTDWDLNRAALREHLAADKIEDFLRWSTIQKTMFVGNVPYVWKELDDIFRNYLELTWIDEWYKLEEALTEPCVGYGDYTYKGDDLWLECDKYLPSFTSGNLIHQLYHLKQWLDRSRKAVDQLTSIVEVGAGYGAMALICHRLGFEGRYYIIDFPELTQLQQYYLSRTLPNKWSNIFWLSAFPSSKLPCDLFIACHSLSEMPIAERERLLAQVDADAYLFASSYEFEGVDNEGWFGEFGESTKIKGGNAARPGYRWEQWAHPWQENALYAVGVKL